MGLSERIAVTGVGVVTALGEGATIVFDALANGGSGISPDPDLQSRGLRTGATARVGGRFSAPIMVGSLRLLRGPAMGLWAAQEALATAGRSAPIGDAGFYASSAFGAPGCWDTELLAGRVGDPELARLAVEDGLSQRAASVAQALGACGPVQSLQAQCAGNAVFSVALEDLRRGVVPWALAGGWEEILYGHLVALDRVRALADACRPFDAERAGTVLGEGAAFLVLEPLELAMKRGALVYAELSAVGQANDAFDLVAPDPEGEGAALAMRRALAASGLEPREVSAVNAHGTGTPQNDLAEARALRRVLGPEGWSLNSIKGALGHAAGAAGPVEAALMSLSIDRQRWLPTAGLQTIDPSLGVEGPLGPHDGPLDVVLSNGFGFGGHDAVLVFERASRRAEPLPKRNERRVFIAGGEAIAPEVSSFAELARRIDNDVPIAPDAALDLEAFAPARSDKGLRNSDEHTWLVHRALDALQPWPRGDRDAAGVVLGAAYPGFNGAYRVGQRLLLKGPSQVYPTPVPHSTSASAASWLALRSGVRALNLTLTSHDVAGVDAVALAAAMVRGGHAFEVLAGGVHAPAAELAGVLRAAGAEGVQHGAGLLLITAEPEASWAEVASVHQAFGPQALEGLAASLPEVDLWIGPPCATSRAARALDIRRFVGSIGAAGGALALLWGAHCIHTGAARRVAVGERSPLGWASVIVLTCPTG